MDGTEECDTKCSNRTTQHVLHHTTYSYTVSPFWEVWTSCPCSSTLPQWQGYCQLATLLFVPYWRAGSHAAVIPDLLWEYSCLSQLPNNSMIFPQHLSTEGYQQELSSGQSVMYNMHNNLWNYHNEKVIFLRAQFVNGSLLPSFKVQEI